MERVREDKTMIQTRTNIVIGLVAFVMVWPVAAMGQYKVEDGRALDHNTRIGSGRRNVATGGNEYGRYSQAVVTGNVSGMSRFRGGLDYSASSEFRDLTGSSDLFEFRSRSYLPPMGSSRRYANPMLRSNVGFGGIGDGVDSGAVLLRGTAGTTAGQVSGQVSEYNMDIRTARSSSGGAGGYRLPSYELPSRVGDGDAGFSAYQFGDEKPLGLTRDEKGGVLAITATPLTGFDMRSPGVKVVGEKVSKGIGEWVAGEKAWGDGEKIVEEDRRGSQGNRVDEKIVGVNVATGYQLGQMLSGLRESEPISNFQMAVTGVDKDEVVFGKDVYVDLLRGIEGWDAERGKRLGVKDRRTEEKTEAESEAAEVEMPDEGDESEGAYGEKNGELLIPKEEPEGDGKLEGGLEGEFEDLIAKLNYDLPAIKTFAGSADTYVDKAMLRAEDYMSKGKYFFATKAYESVLRMELNHPLAQVGMVHAQLGSGMYMSAGRALYVLLDAHPELISAKYSEPVLPCKERMKIIETGLRELVIENEKSIELSLLLAYVGYQIGDGEMVDKGLTLLGERSPKDGLVELLRRLWVDGEMEGDGSGSGEDDVVPEKPVK